MEPHELNRMFDQLVPTREQEEAGLRRLLEPERKVLPMKKLKRLTVVGIAAALMVITCAAAVVTGIDQRILDYFGSGPQQAELLVPCAVPVDITVENNGAVFHVSQVLMDRYSLLVLADFTAPEGTVLDEGKRLQFDMYCQPLDQEGKFINPHRNWLNVQKLLDDGDPLDNHLTVLYEMLPFPGFQPDDEIKNMYLTVKHLVSPDGNVNVPVYLGDWSCQIPISWQDMGQSIPVNQVVSQLDGTDITATEVYLSPMTLQIYLEGEFSRDNWLLLPDAGPVTLTSKNGRTVQMKDFDASGGEQSQSWSFQLDEIIDPAQFQDGTITLSVNGESVDISLDGLVPAE